MSKTLKMFIREVLENIEKDGVQYPIDTMQYGDAEYKATLEKYKSPSSNIERSFRLIKAEFDNAKERRLKYLRSQFGVRLEELADKFEIENLDIALIKKVMIDAVEGATLKIACYPQDLTPYLQQEGDTLVFDPVWSGPWRDTIKKLGTGVAYAFTYSDSIYVPPPSLVFNKDKTLLSSAVDLSVSTFEHEFIHIEDHAIESVVEREGITSPNQLSVDLLGSALLPPKDLTFDKLSDALSVIPRLVAIEAKEGLSDDLKNISMCIYFLYLAEAVAQNSQNAPAQASDYHDAATRLVSMYKIDDKLDNSLKGSAKNHGSKGHLRVSLLFMRDSLSRALDAGGTISKQAVIENVKNDLARSHQADTVTRCLSLLAITNFDRVKDLKLVASADFPVNSSL
jgi:hypothetical protein